MIVLCLVLVLGLISKRECFNLSPGFADVLTDPTRQGKSYFGYSVFLRTSSGKYASSIIVGAPKANSNYPLHRSIHRPGVVYQCNIDSKIGPPFCYPLLLDKTGNQQELKPFYMSYTDRKDYSMLGATITGLDNRGSLFVACAPLWANAFNKDLYLANGLCYWLDNTMDANRTAKRLIPLLDGTLQSFETTTKSVYLNAFGQAGMSAKIIRQPVEISRFQKENETYELLLGAPGMVSWQGGVVRYQSGYSLFSDVLVPNTYYSESRIPDESYFGYAVESGRFLSKSTRHLYVASAPRDSYKGKVFIFDMTDQANRELIIKAEMAGKDLGEYFGSSLCVVDFTGDGLDDLVIGAPQNGEDEGAVYVFINKDEWRFDELPTLIHKKEPGARFGTSMTSLNDLNQDGFKDVAVGAPYEDEGRGVVYIYLGNSKGLGPDYSQRIEAKEIRFNLKGFGFSLSGGVDVDRNTFTDLGVGSYLSNHAVIIRSHPVGKLTARIKTSKRDISLEERQIRIEGCITYKGMRSAENVTVQIIPDPSFRRAVLMPEGLNSKTVVKEMKNNIETCVPYMLEIHSSVMDFSRPIEVLMNYNLDHDVSTDTKFCGDCSVLDPSESNSTLLTIPFVNGCGDDNVCQTDLQLDAEFYDTSSTRGSFDNNGVHIKATVRNVGEPAFQVRLNVIFPSQLEIARLPSECHQSNEQNVSLFCELGTIFNLDSNERTVNFDFDGWSIPIIWKELNITMVVFSHGENKGGQKNVELSLPLIIDATLSISGKPLPEQLIYKELNGTVKNPFVEFSQIYDLVNFGPSPTDYILVNFKLPVGILVDGRNSTFLEIKAPKAFLNDQPIICSSTEKIVYTKEDIVELNLTKDGSLLDAQSQYKRSKRDVKDIEYARLPENRTLFLNCSEDSDEVLCMDVSCKVGFLKPLSTGATFVFTFVADISKLEKILDNKDIVMISSKANVIPLLEKEKTSISTIVDTMLLGSVLAPEVSYWIYILAAIIGLLILVAIVSALAKYGFFKREKKEEMEMLKTEQEDENEANADM